MNLGEYLEATYTGLKQIQRRGKVTGGSTTTVVDSSLTDIYQDNQPKNKLLFLSNTTDGAAPIHQYGLITAYTNATTLFSVPTMTAAAGAGDRYAIADQLYSVYDMEYWLNEALKMLGPVPDQDTSLAITSNTFEYAMPLAVKGGDIFRIEAGSAALGWQDVTDRYVPPTAPGVQETIVFNNYIYPVGLTLKIWYKKEHATLSIYSDPVSEYIHRELAVAAAVYRAMEAKGLWVGDEDATAEFNQVQRRYYEMKAQHPIKMPAESPSYLSIGNLSDKRNVRTVLR